MKLIFETIKSLFVKEEIKETPFVDKWLDELLKEPIIQIATTKDFNDNESAKGNFLPSETEESIEKIMPLRATSGSAGIDLKAFIEDSCGYITINPNETKLVKTGFKWAIPEGYVGMVCSRSGMALKNSVFVLNAPGIIDSDYRGDVGIILHNSGNEIYTISNGDRIAQMVIIESPILQMERVLDLEVTERGEGGFGSTGKGS